MYLFRKSRKWLIFLSVLVSIEAGGLWYLKYLPYSRIDVVNTERREDLYWNPRQSPDGWFRSPGGILHYLVKENYPSLRNYRKIVPEKLNPGKFVQVEEVVRLRQWVRDQFRYESYLSGYGMFDYEKTISLRKQERGGGICDAFVTFFVGSALSVGIPARVVHLQSKDWQGHYISEVWVDELGKWIAVDVLLNALYYLDGKPVSALEGHLSYRDPRKRGKLKMVRNGSTTQPNNFGVILERFANISVVNRTDFKEYGIPFFGKKLQFVHFADNQTPRLGRQERILRPITLILLPGFILVCMGVMLISIYRRTS
jgi:hypothetical protein